MIQKRKKNKPIMVPGAQSKMQEMRYEIGKKLGYVNLPYEDDWWNNLTQMQQSEINGHVTKLLIMKAQYDMAHGTFKH